MSLTITSTTTLPSGHSIPRLGFGVYRNDEPYPAVLAALQHGYRHIDTAEWYANEASVGKAIRDSGLKREEVFVTTKIPSGCTDPASSISRSLQELGTDYVDLWLVHSAHGGKDCRLNIYKTLVDAKSHGKARNIGVSNFNVRHLEEIREAGLPLPAVNQIELHPFCRQDPIVKYCEEHGILLEAYCPIVRGDFSDPVLQDISKRVKKKPEHVLLRWSLQRGYIPLPKSANPERIISNADVYNFELSEEDMQALNARPQNPISWNPIDEE